MLNHVTNLNHHNQNQSGRSLALLVPIQQYSG